MVFATLPAVVARPYPVEYRRGVHLPEAGLWLDPRDRRDLAVVSHAHGDHIAPHRAVICTEPTFRLLVHRIRRPVEPRVVGHGEELCIGDATVSLHPAGHVLGASQVLVRHRGLRVLYSGDIRLRPSLTCAQLEHVEADVLVVESTFGHPRYRFPPIDEVVEAVVRFCRRAIEAGATPVLLAYSLGKAQELMARLAGCGLPVHLHASVYAIAMLYRDLGVDLPHAGVIDEAGDEPIDLQGGVAVVPTHLRFGSAVRRLGSVRRAYLSGWAVDPWSAERLGCDAAFPLSDHCDFGDLVAYAERTGARRVFTVFGFADDLARELRRRGMDASPLCETEQLKLALA